MNGPSVIAIIIITALVAGAVISAIRKRRKGDSCCGCSLADHCCKKKL